MATFARPVAPPTRDELRRSSRWTWLPLVLAALSVIANMTSPSAVSLEEIIGTALATGPFLVAATLIAVAPRERLLNLAAIGFAFGPTLRLTSQLFSLDLHDLLRMTSSGYAELAEMVQVAAAFLGGLNWLVYTGAVLCLAFYIGIVRSQRGWWIVGVAVALAAVQVIVNVMTLLPFWEGMSMDPASGVNPLLEVASTVLGSLDLVAWGYLTAVALDRGFVLIPLAGGLMLVEVALGLVSSLLPVTYYPHTFGIYYVLSAAFWGLLILGVLYELPRNMVTAGSADAAPAAPTEATSSGR